MKAASLLLSLVCASEAFQNPSRNTKLSTKLSSSVADQEKAKLEDLKAIAKASNPVLNYYDPLDLVNFPIGDSRVETIGWLRQAEIKHGRVAMAAFVGYCVQSQGVRWTFDGPWAEVGLTPEQQWDAISPDFKWAIISIVGFLEFADEADTTGHYVYGEKEPGRHPFYQRETNRSAESLLEGKIKEINNGRLAMVGIMSLVSASSISGSVPVLTKLIPQYDGNIWAPFQSNWQLVSDGDPQGFNAGFYAGFAILALLFAGKQRE